MLRSQISLGFIAATLLCGCGRPSVQQAGAMPAPEKSVPSEVKSPVRVSELAAGARPKTIRNAEVYDIHEFHQSHIADGEYVCIEGRVKASDSLLGVPRVALECSLCKIAIYCEGHWLGDYQIPLNANMMVRGRVFGGGTLVDADLVTQSQIDASIAKDHAAE